MRDATYHLTDRQLSAALHKIGEPSVGGVPSIPNARGLYEKVQTTAADNLEQYLDMVQDGSLRIVADQPDLLLLADPNKRVLAKILARNDENTPLNEEVIRSVMAHLANDILSHDWSEEDPIVIAKPEDWKRGEDGVERILKWFLTTGMTPTEALDFWATVLRGISQAEWATVRDVDEDEITANVTSAREHLHSR